MPFYKNNLFAALLLLVLSVCLAVSLIACDIRDIPLGKDPGRISEQIGGDAAIDPDSDEDNTAGRSEGTGGVGGRDGVGNDAKGGRDTHRDNEYRDAERNDEGDPRDSGIDSAVIDPSIQFEVCGFTFCLPGSVCCESCGICTLPGTYCPQDCWEWIVPTDFCDPTECGAPPGRAIMICPMGTIGGLMCTKMDNGTCAWQIVPCTSPNSKPCGESVGLECGPFEYCDAPDCGKGTKTGFCQLRPTGCPRDYDPVCGCDGNEYNNSCLAQEAGTNVAYEGPCR